MSWNFSEIVDFRLRISIPEKMRIYARLLHSYYAYFIDSSKEGLQTLGKTFSSSKYLAQIDLSRNNNIGDEGISCLDEAAKEHAGNEAMAFPSLKKMILSECNIGPLGMQSLAEIFLGANANRSKPIDLVLSSNPIGSEGCRTLAKLIVPCGRGSILSCLHISQCFIGDEGIKLLSNAATSNSCMGLNLLDLSENSITSDGARVFAGSLVKCWPSFSDGVSSHKKRWSIRRCGEDGEPISEKLRLDMHRMRKRRSQRSFE